MDPRFAFLFFMGFLVSIVRDSRTALIHVYAVMKFASLLDCTVCSVLLPMF
jgi:hypothetical protein